MQSTETPSVPTPPSSPRASTVVRRHAAAPSAPRRQAPRSRTPFAIAAYTGVIFALSLAAEIRIGGALVSTFTALAGWSFAVSVLHALPRSLTISRDELSRFNRVRAVGVRAFRAFLLLTAVGGVAYQLWRATQAQIIFPPSADAAARLLALITGAAAVASWFLAALARADAVESRDARLDPLRHLLLALALVQAATALLLFLRLTAGFDSLRPLTFFIGSLSALLALEGIVGLAIGFYQPRTVREHAQPFGGSTLLGWVFRWDNPWTAVARSLEKTFGLKVGETALFPFLQRIFEPAFLGGFLLLWLGTAVTMVPPDGDGVLVQLGHHRSPTLNPGLHFHLPWPFARVELVPARRVHELTLGFDQDLAGPILWAEQHYAGEKSLLVGQGDELLTVSLPIHYRISDPSAFLQNTRDPAAAIRALGYRELLTLTSTHSSFDLMTTRRAEVAAALRTQLQAACDRHHLGLEILWVGLKDIHPPVPVAPAFQDVVSAEEEKLTTIDRERAQSITTLQEASSAARRLRSEADAFLHERSTLAAGEATRFTANAIAASAAAEVFRTRRTFESTELGLKDAKNLLVVPSATARTEYFLDVKSPVPFLPTMAR